MIVQPNACQQRASPANPALKKEPLMAIDVETVRKVAKLARIATPEARLPALAQELSTIVAWIEQLSAR